MVSKDIPDVTPWRPPSSQYHGVKEHISNLASFRWPSSSSNSLDHGHQVYLHTHFLMASLFTQSYSSGASTNSIDHDLEVQLYVHSITSGKCISTYVRWPPRCTCQNVLYQSLGVYLWVQLHVIFWRFWNFSPGLPAARLDIPCIDS
jgi:hypothetical protein